MGRIALGFASLVRDDIEFVSDLIFKQPIVVIARSEATKQSMVATSG